MKPRGNGPDLTGVFILALIGLACVPYIVYRVAMFLWWAFWTLVEASK